MSRLYSDLKSFAFPEQLQALRNQQVVAPVHLRIKPTNKCNHDCWYCAYHVSNLQLGEDMEMDDTIPEAKMFEIVDDVLEMGVKAVTFSGGGEPLLYKPLPKVIEKLTDGGVRVATLTNGSNLKGKIADILAERATWVRISLDGYDEESYIKARRVQPGTFTKLLENMENFSAKTKSCVLGASFIIDKDNHNHIDEICSKLKNAGVSHVKLSGVVVGNSPDENNNYHQPIREEVDEAISKAQELNDATFSVINHYHALESRVWHKPYQTCPFLLFRPVIGADQTVYTCQDKAYTQSGTLGSIKSMRFKDFWFSEHNRQQLYSFNPSQSCNHHCVAHSQNLALHDYLALDDEHMAFV